MENSTARIPAFRPKLPNVEKLIPYLREIDKNRWYSNRGMLAEKYMPDGEPWSIASSIYWDQSRMLLLQKLPDRSVGRISFLIGAEQEIDRLTRLSTSGKD